MADPTHGPPTEGPSHGPIHGAPRLVHIVDDAEQTLRDLAFGSDATAAELTMVVVLSGFLDAGQAAELAARHLGGLGPGTVVATFDVDALHDYRARRPAVTFDRDHYTDYDAPRLVVRALRDSGGAPFLLLHGPEPDIRWEGFSQAVRQVVERLGVRRVVNLGSVPMAVPHTRPTAITPHANRPELLSGPGIWAGELRVPASAQSLLEIRLGEWGHDCLGYVAHIPHYLAQMAYPQAATTLLEHLELGGQLSIDLTDMREAATATEQEVARYLADNDDVADVVRGLEQQYDAFQQAETSGSSLLAQNQPLPTGDELGKEFEQFLAGLDGPAGEARRDGREDEAGPDAGRGLGGPEGD